jgi:hypothetical protein
MKILFFSPFQGIPQHSFPQTYLARLLQEMSFEVDIMSCDGLLVRGCPVMHTAGKSSASVNERSKVCCWCRSYCKMTLPNFTSQHFSMENFYSEASEKKVTEILSSIQVHEIPDLEIEGVKLGRISSYTFLTHWKINHILSLTPQQFEMFKGYLEATLRTFYSYSHFLDHHPNYSEVFVYDSLYEINHVVEVLNRQNGVQTTTMVAGCYFPARYDSLLLSRVNSITHLIHALNYFEKNHQRLRLPESVTSEVFTYLNSLWKKQDYRVFSLAKGFDPTRVKTVLGLHENYKKTVLLALSTEDEFGACDFATEGEKHLVKGFRLFKTQREWLINTVRFFSQHPEYKLIIRTHPREYARFVSQAALQLEADLSPLPENISLNVPDDKISIYDLFDLIDLCLISTSSVGLEAGCLGIPILAYTQDCTHYPTQMFHRIPKTIDEYCKAIEACLKKEPSRQMDQIFLVIRYFVFLFNNLVVRWDSTDFWNTRPPRDPISQVVKQNRKQAELPAFSYADYELSCQMTQDEKSWLRAYLLQEKEFYRIKEHGFSEKESDLGLQERIHCLKKLLLSVSGLDYKKESETISTLANEGNKTLRFFLDCLDSLESQQSPGTKI